MTSQANSRVLVRSQLAEVAAEASLDGDRAAFRDIVSYLADDVEELTEVLLLAMDKVRRAAGGQPAAR